MTIETLVSSSITNLDGGATNYTGIALRNTRGMGAAATLKVVEDYVTVSAAASESIGSTFRIVRFPTSSIIRQVQICSDANTSSAAPAGDAPTAGEGAFGNGIDDGTPAAVAGQIPTIPGAGEVTSVSVYDNPNILFGTYTVQSHLVGIPWGTDITLGGAAGLEANNYILNIPTSGLNPNMQQPLWEGFGFTGGQGYAQDPGGFFDLMAYVSTAAATGGSGTRHLWARVAYIEA